MQKVARGRSARNLLEAQHRMPSLHYSRHVRKATGSSSSSAAAQAQRAPQQRAVERRYEQAMAATKLQKVARGSLTRRGVIGARPRHTNGGRGGGGGGGGGARRRPPPASSTAAATRLQAVARGRSERNVLRGAGGGKPGVVAARARRERMARRAPNRRLNAAPDVAAIRIQAVTRGKTHRNLVAQRRAQMEAERAERARAYARAHDPNAPQHQARRKPPLKPHETHKAATRLQKVARGRSTRRLLIRGAKHMMSANASRGAAEHAEHEALASRLEERSVAQVNLAELSHLSAAELHMIERHAAVTKLQAVHRGKSGRVAIAERQEQLRQQRHERQERRRQQQREMEREREEEKREREEEEAPTPPPPPPPPPIEPPSWLDTLPSEHNVAMQQAAAEAAAAAEAEQAQQQQQQQPDERSYPSPPPDLSTEGEDAGAEGEDTAEARAATRMQSRARGKLSRQRTQSLAEQRRGGQEQQQQQQQEEEQPSPDDLQAPPRAAPAGGGASPPGPPLGTGPPPGASSVGWRAPLTGRPGGHAAAGEAEGQVGADHRGGAKGAAAGHEAAAAAAARGGGGGTAAVGSRS